MPPTKGAPLVSSTQQKKLPFKTVKHGPQLTKGVKSEVTTSVPKGKKKKGKKILSGNAKQDEALLKLRIPVDLCKMLPSVKKFSNGKKKLPKEFPIKEEKEDRPQPLALLGIKRRRGETQSYHLRLVKEEKITGMIWDVAMTIDERVVICTSEGAFLCDSDLENPQKLDNIILPGGLDFFRDGRMAIVCRFMDSVNIFSKDGKFINSFEAGPSPQGLVINGKEEILVTDTGTRCARLYTLQGKQIDSIPEKGDGYELKWPLYITVNSTQHILISDSHLQSILVFDPNLKYKGEFPLKTFGGNYVLKPHGICTNNDDVFVIDRAIDSMEVFRPDGTYLQTLLPSEEGGTLRPKVTRTSKDGSKCIIGGITGLVRIYEFVVGDTDSHVNLTPVKKEKVEKFETDDIIVLD